MSKNRAEQRSRPEWDRLVDEWSSSGEKQKEFAISRGINPMTFQGQVWRSRKRRKLSVKNKDASCRFVEVSTGAPVVESQYRGGCLITMSKTEIALPSSAEADFVFQILSRLGHAK